MNKTINYKIKTLTWHVHGSYLYYLTQAKNIDFYVPTKPGKPEGYGGAPKGNFVWGENVHEVPAQNVKDLDLDVIIFQSPKNYYEDQYKILSPEQRKLPQVYIEHDPPREIPTETKHHVNNPNVTLVHVTHFNDLMWDSNSTPTTVIDHGVMIPQNVLYTGEIPKGVVVVNNIQKRGRRLGYDVLEKVRPKVSLDVVGMGSQNIGGLGEIEHDQLPQFISQYRFFFNPIRYTSLGLSILEAMMIGLPIVGLATTELVTVVENGRNGFIDTDIDRLITQMNRLIHDKNLAMELSVNARDTAISRFSIERFTNDWEKLLQNTVQKHTNASNPILHNSVERITL